MKKINMVLVLVALSSIMFGQTEKGQVLLDVDFSFSAGSVDMADPAETVNKFRKLNFDLRLGYTIVKNLEVGLGVRFINKLKQKTKDKLSLYNIFVRYYLSNSNLKPFIGAAYGIGPVKKEIPDMPDIKMTLTQISGSLGLAYFINKHWGFELAFAYFIDYKQKDNDVNAISFGFDGSYFSVVYGVIVSF